MTPEEQIKDLERKVKDLEARLNSAEKQRIVVVGNFDGTNIPITIHGIRRKIATTAP